MLLYIYICYYTESLPRSWEDMEEMTSGTKYKAVELKSGDDDYTKVENAFRETVKDAVIVRIQRIQNPTLYWQYAVKKKSMKCSEKDLFHGTSKESLDQINAHGFNRSFAGKNGELFL